jgi:uncharacterized protein YneF (UPF0154 family)
MIITLGLIGFIIIGIILYNCSKNTNLDWSSSTTFELIGCLMLTLGIVGTLFSGTFILSNAMNHDLKYQNKLHEREMLEYRIEHMEDNITGNEMLYNDIVEFNNELRATKKWANSPWTNWFNNQDIAAMDYIELEE